METKNNGLDSVSRRRIIADILKIPPVLLGIGSIVDLEEFLKQYQESKGTALSAPATIKNTPVEKETVSLYKDAFLIYSSMHSTSTAQDSLFEVEQWINRINADMLRSQSHQKHQLQSILWDFHALTAKIYADDRCDWTNAFTHLNTAMDLANTLNSNDLRTASLYRSGQIRFAQRNFHLAKSDLDAAIGFAKNASPHLKGAVYAAAGLAHALVDKDAAGKKHAQSLMEEAGKYVATRTLQTDEHVIKFSTGKYLAEKADALITLGRPGKALEVLDDAEEGSNPHETRRLAYIDILRAEAYIQLKTPQFDTATSLLSSAFASSSSIKSEYNIAYIQRLQARLSTSPYGNAVDVSDLEMSIKSWRKNKRLN